MENEQLAYNIVENLSKMLTVTVFHTGMEEDGAFTKDLSPFGLKLYDNILNTLLKENIKNKKDE